MTLQNVFNALEEWAPLHLQESYDNCGLLVGKADQSFSGALICLDCTEAVIDEAIALGANVVIAHHPLIFSGIKKITGATYVERCIIKAIQNNIAIYAIHTNLDNVLHGVSGKMSDLLLLQNKKILWPKKGADNAGAGIIGELKGGMDTVDFMKQIKSVFGAGSLRHTELLSDRVSKIALCGGSGSFLLGEAIAQQADVFITSDIKYHQFFDAESRIVIVDIGHYEAEKFTKELICEFLSEKFPTFALHLSKINTNPVNYL
jgi:dinuclear metal center YbgI/SA1388 family protein